ncbi:Caspase-1 [Chionoecetes opilio]|uniref:Caspase-1 n=1 Tax=Chionoecetes opilio TaxID=41210 RepID=A0A8J4XTC5_CHIOP|nr:Caspase-1 [Chionoecetes opilio]
MLVKSRPVEIFHRRTSTGLIYKNCPDWWIFDRRTNTSEPKAASRDHRETSSRGHGISALFIIQQPWPEGGDVPPRRPQLRHCSVRGCRDDATTRNFPPLMPISSYIASDILPRPPAFHREPVASDSMVPDDSDARILGWGRHLDDERPRAVMSVGRDALFYKDDHKKRGQAIIFANDYFDDPDLSSRKCASHDTAISQRAFEHLGFEVMVHRNLTKANFEQKLQEGKIKMPKPNPASDCLVVVFMSHGNVSRNNKEFLCTRDDKVDTSELWKNFTRETSVQPCGEAQVVLHTGLGFAQAAWDRQGTMLWPTSLLLFFLEHQALSFITTLLEKQPAGVDGGWQENGSFSLLLRVTREVATQYESFTPQSDLLHRNKQTPYMVSTLMRHLYFPMPSSISTLSWSSPLLTMAVIFIPLPLPPSSASWTLFTT